MRFIDCFRLDHHKYNPVPKGLLKKLYALWFSQRYSMTVYLRLTEYFYDRYEKGKGFYFKIFADYFKRKNEVKNQFEHGYKHQIAPGTLFHHTGVTLNTSIIIENNVQVFKNVTFALVKGKVCEIGEGSVVFSHVIILGKKIGKNCVIGAGSVVTKDIPDGSIVAGNPARVIGSCTDTHQYLEFS